MNAKAKGTRNEHRSMRLLEAAGYHCTRSGASLGVFDIIGMYRRLVKRMGKKKALVAVGHSILVIVYHVLKSRTSYQELGGDYFDQRHVAHHRARLIRQLEGTGLKVTVEELPVAA